MKERYWFRPKSFGYGAVPTTWEGWAVTLGSALSTGGAILIAVLAEARRWPHRGVTEIGCAIFAIVSIFALTVIARAKTNGNWRWRG